MVVPAGVFFLLSFAAPMFLAGRLSFFATDYVSSKFVGLENFAKALKDPYFIKSFANVFWFVLGIAPGSILMGYWIASFLFDLDRRLQAAGRFICYIPALTAGLVMTMLWRWFLMRGGLINQFLAWGGLPEVGWLGQVWPSRVSIVMVTLSSGSGGFVILFMAAMFSIPRELHDAAMIDGASERQYKRKVVRPLMMPIMLLGLMLVIVGTMQAWETIYVLTGEGGPYGSTATPVYNIFQTAFIFQQAGYASAKGFLLLVVIAAIVFLKQRVERWAGQIE